MTINNYRSNQSTIQLARGGPNAGQEARRGSYEINEKYLQFDPSRDGGGWKEVGRVAPPNLLADCAREEASGGVGKERGPSAPRLRGASPRPRERRGETYLRLALQMSRSEKRVQW
ncbi:hypothetical protein GUJ93_ZPchr0001g31670 [Zizania palustris]|uniref:Uncharacterized protein n=1 Tax=Zizania palustris TaxID=103762 RepID=A0A8J5V0F0_ZIZPA|nr:hypothetical protein GUJ93_ZPchr0001g31670 [Zizania palustris]